jgi:hypothetical protein
MRTKSIRILFSITLSIAICPSIHAEDDAKAAIRTKLESQFPLTQPTADQTEIVTAGAVLVFSLKGSDVIMSPVSSTNFFQNTYKDGKITQNSFGKSLRALDKFNRLPGVPPASAPATRTFVPGEKMWVTKIDVKDDGVVFELFTDAYSDVRYKATLKFPFTKGLVPAPDQMEKLVSTVFKVQPSEDTNTTAQQKGPASGGDRQQPPPSAAPPAPAAVSQAAEPQAVIPPPPPPPADAPPAAPKTISVGQTIEQVVSAFGQPKRIAKVGANKQIYYYEDMKVTFVDGKATDIQ